MKQMFKVFYRTFGVLHSDRILNLPDFKLKELPRDAVYHAVGYRNTPAEIDTTQPFYQGYSKKVLCEYVLDYANPIGTFRRPLVNIKELARSFRQTHFQKFQYLETPYLTNQGPDALIVENYGYLDSVHKYPQLPMTPYYLWANKQRTLWNKVNEIAKSTDRHQFIPYPIPAVLQGRTVLDKYTKDAPSSQMVQIIGRNGQEGFLQLDLWQWLSVEHRGQSMLSAVEPKHYGKVNLVFIGSSGNQCLINLSYLNSWIKGQPNTTEFGSLVQFDPAFMQKLFLKLCMTLNAIQTEGGMLDDVPASATQNAPTPSTEKEPSAIDPDQAKAENVELDATVEDVVEETPDELKNVGESELRQNLKAGASTSVIEKDEKLTSLNIPDLTREMMADVEKDIEALDRLSLVHLKDQGKSLSAEEPEVEEQIIDIEAVKAKVYEDKVPAVRLKQWIQEDAEANLITAADYRKMEQVVNAYASSTDPYGSNQPRLEAMAIKPEDIALTPESSAIITTESVPDKSMASSSIRDFDRQYLKTVHRKDVLSAVDSLQSAGVLIRGHEVDITHSALGSYEEHTLDIKPVDGAPSTVRFTLPVVSEDGTFMAGGNKYLMRKQRVDLPIRKIAPRIVALSTYYGKTFVQVNSKVTNDSLAWLYRQINAAALMKGMRIHDVNPGNVFDHDFKAPFLYNALASEYDQLQIGDYSLFFDHHARKERVNPELLSLIEKKGRVWCGWSKAMQPIVLGTDDHFYQLSKEGETPLGDVYTFFGLDKSKAPIDFAEVRIFSKYIPIGIVLSYYLGFSNLIAFLGEEFRVVPARKNKQLEQDEYAISFQDESYVFKTKNRVNTLVLAGFGDYEKLIKGFDRKEFENKDVYLNILMGKKIGAIYVRELEMMGNAFVDPISKEILKDMGEPTTLTGLIVRAASMLTTFDHPASQDRKAMRDRGYERFAGVVYKETMQAIRQFRNKNLVGRSKVDMSPYQVWNAIMKDNSLKIVEDINPIQNLKESEVITYSGAGGRDKDTMTKATRAFHPNDIGVLSESTVDSTAVGTIAYLSANPNIKNVRGMMSDEKVLTPTSILSTSALLSPASSNDNPKRVMFITTQHSHTIASPGYRQPYLRTGYEFVIGKRTSKLFSTAAREDGVVESVTPKGIVVKYASGEEVGIELGRLYGKAEGTTYPHDLVTPLKEGEAFKAGDVLVYNTKFFEPDFLNPKEVVLKMNDVVTTVFMESNQTHEDSCAISDVVGRRFKTEVTKMKSYVIRFDQNLIDLRKIGEKVEPKDVLMIIEDEITASAGAFSQDALSTLKRLSNVAPRAGVMGVVEKIEVFYHGDKRDMSLTLKKLAEKSDADMAATAKSVKKPVVTGKVTEEYRVSGTPLELNHAEVRIYLSVVAETGVGDKAVFGHQMKSTVAEVQSNTMHTEDGQQVEATFSYRSVANRGVLSPSIIGTTITLLDILSKKAVEIYEA